jgi:UDP-N-acetyl-D-galactosamine dehydrogenase
MIVTAGTHKAASIKIAEAAKVIENTQRDINIALINELAVIFNKLDIDTEAVLEAAGTKWNFLPFRPGLVGGHCIGVDPYYLAHKCAEVGYHPELILAGRRLNASMGSYIAGQVVRLMLKKKIQVNQSKVLIMGLAFKENCPDIRNTRVIDVVTELKSYGSDVDVHDPHVDKDQVLAEYDIELTDTIENIKYDAIVLAVAHSQFKKLSKENFDSYGKDPYVLYDIKYLLESDQVDGRL